MKDYNIPQDRQRILIYGVRKDLPLSLNFDNISIPERRFNRDVLEFSLENSLKITSKKIIDIIPVNKYIIPTNEEEQSITNTPPTNLIKCYNNEEISYRKRSKSTWSCVIDLDDVSRTILSSYGRMPRLFVPLKYNNEYFLRPYTILELQRIQGFPDTFVFCGNNINKIKQIGNAVPPLFIFYVMRYILNQFE